jgi:hypothetical protein
VASLAARDGELVQIDLDELASAADNEATVRAFWDREAGPLGFDPRVGDDARFLDEAVARAAGNLQHAVQLRKQLAALSHAVSGEAGSVSQRSHDASARRRPPIGPA